MSSSHILNSNKWRFEEFTAFYFDRQYLFVFTTHFIKDYLLLELHWYVDGNNLKPQIYYIRWMDRLHRQNRYNCHQHLWLTLLFVWRATMGVGGGYGSAGGERSFTMAEKSRQQAEAVVLVTRPICPRTALICLRVQRAMCGWSARIASWSHWPDQRCAIRVGWLKVVRRIAAPDPAWVQGGVGWSRDWGLWTPPSERPSCPGIRKGHGPATRTCDRSGNALTCGSCDWVATALFSPCHRRSHSVRRAWTRFRSGWDLWDQEAAPILFFFPPFFLIKEPWHEWSRERVLNRWSSCPTNKLSLSQNNANHPKYWILQCRYRRHSSGFFLFPPFFKIRILSYGAEKLTRKCKYHENMYRREMAANPISVCRCHLSS